MKQNRPSSNLHHGNALFPRLYTNILFEKTKQYSMFLNFTRALLSALLVISTLVGFAQGGNTNQWTVRTNSIVDNCNSITFSFTASSPSTSKELSHITFAFPVNANSRVRTPGSADWSFGNDGSYSGQISGISSLSGIKDDEGADEGTSITYTFTFSGSNYNTIKTWLASNPNLVIMTKAGTQFNAFTTRPSITSPCSTECFNPLAPTQEFNVFLENGATLITNETEGPIAMGGNLTFGNNNNYQVAIHSAGSFRVNNIPVGLLINGRVFYNSGNQIQVNNGNVKIGNGTGSTVWYRDNNNAATNIQITSGNFNANPRIHLNNNANTLATSASANPIIQGGLVNFSDAFSALRANATTLSNCANNATLTNPNGGAIGNTNLPNQVKINLNNGVNVLNVSGTDLNNVSVFTFNNKPNANRILVVNVNAPGTFNWNVWNQAGIGGSDASYVIYNFYNTTTLNINGNNNIWGTVFAPSADIVKTVNQSNIDGQVVGKSFMQSGGEVHYYRFLGCITPCSVAPPPCVPPTVAALTGTQQVCVGGTTNFASTTAGGVWTTSNGAVATVNSNGVVSGLSTGTATITYTVTSAPGCSTAVSRSVTVNAAPAQPAVITGTAQVCVGSTTQLSSATAGGTWSSSNASVATVSASGVVTGVAAGTTTITYTVSNDCGTATRTQVVTVNDCTPPPPPPPPAPAPCYPKGIVDLGSSASAAEALFSRLDFSAEARIGGASTYELDIHRIQPFTVFNPTQEFNWQNGVAVPFTVTYNPSAVGNNKFIFTVGSGASTRTLQFDPTNPPSGSAFPTDFNGIWFFTRGSSAGNSLISNLTLNGENLSNIDVTNTSSNLVLRGYNVSQGFTLTGNITYSWTGNMPTQSNLNFNVKLGKLNGNPAPICGFAVNNESQDITGNSFVFTAQPPTVGNTYSWNFGDGSPVKTGTQVSHTFTQVGNYVVTVTVTGPGGCTSVCSKTVFVTNGVSGGATGGIESYSLGEVIGKRNIAKAKAGQLGETNYGATPKWNGPVSNDRGGVATMSTGSVRLADLIPSQVSGLQAYVTSPTDLTQFTNAVEVMSVDFTRGNVPRAVAFATKTLDEVYNHTKPICDRLRGAQLLDVQKIEIATIDMLSYTVRQPNGKIEYAVSFSAGAKNGATQFQMQSNWFTRDYASNDVMFNFQVWAETPVLMQQLTEQIVGRLSANGSLVQQTGRTVIPAAYVVSGQRVGSKLVLSVENGTANSSGYFELEEKLNEKSTVSKRTVPFTIQQRGRSTLELDMRDGFESDVRMFINGELMDLVYMSDGIWGLDFDRARTTIKNFTVSNDAARVYQDEYPLFRDVKIEGTTSNYITAYKFLRGGGVAADLSAYKTLRFEASGGHRLKITLVKEGVTNWNDQYTYSINLDQAKREYQISLNDFVSSGISGKIKANDVTSVVFSIEVNGSNTAVNTTLGKVGFTKVDVDYLRSLEAKEVQLYPNPSNGRFTIQFRSAVEAPLTMRMTDAATGRVVMSRAIQAVQGENQVTVELGRQENMSSQGLYIVNLDGANGLRYKPAKISIKR